LLRVENAKKEETSNFANNVTQPLECLGTFTHKLFIHLPSPGFYMHR